MTIAVLLWEPTCHPRPFLAGHAYRPINLKSLNRPRAAGARARAQRVRARMRVTHAPSMILERRDFLRAARIFHPLVEPGKKLPGDGAGAAIRRRRTWSPSPQRKNVKKVIEVFQPIKRKIRPNAVVVNFHG
ncbi:hypothetical protein [Sphingomonas sp. Root1294]|uniref:hypothetical protein n=1 Tax=Sphingomonas sp. Root1294 TaxID=1736447 RepID=UPI001F41FA4E|nr:hypothetical protein [Sphingomonas sp. Root1294]